MHESLLSHNSLNNRGVHPEPGNTSSERSSLEEMDAFVGEKVSDLCPRRYPDGDDPVSRAMNIRDVEIDTFVAEAIEATTDDPYLRKMLHEAIAKIDLNNKIPSFLEEHARVSLVSSRSTDEHHNDPNPENT